MQEDIRRLIEDQKPLPAGTRIKTTCGGVHTGGEHELPSHVLESANRVPNTLSDDVPFWVKGWTDLHDDLLI